MDPKKPTIYAGNALNDQKPAARQLPAFTPEQEAALLLRPSTLKVDSAAFMEEKRTEYLETLQRCLAEDIHNVELRGHYTEVKAMSYADWTHYYMNLANEARKGSR